MSEHDEDEDETTKRRASFRPPLLGFVLTSFISPEQASPSRSSRSFFASLCAHKRNLSFQIGVQLAVE